MLRAQIDLLDDVHAPGSARRAARAILRGWGYRDADVLAAVELIVTELVTNALRHAPSSGAIQLQLERDPTLRICVADGSALVPVAQAIDHGAESGRGLHIVDHLADAWGLEDWQDGKRIWVQLPYVPKGL